MQDKVKTTDSIEIETIKDNEVIKQISNKTPDALDMIKQVIKDYAKKLDTRPL